jgi:2,3-bisphosphoglycerate-independent phosphoglycerate mutase
MTASPMSSSPVKTTPPKPLVLCILDGFGERADRNANAVKSATCPTLDRLRRDFPCTLISASGEDVGLPHGQMGNSEVGHLNFGAGRVAMMDLSRIDNAVAKRTLRLNEVILKLLEKHDAFASRNNPHFPEPMPRFHLFALVSDGGVHSSIEHLFALIDLLDEEGVDVVVHAFLDGRDTPPKSALDFIEQLERKLEGTGDGPLGVIGTVSGRYYAMDRDKHWDRVHLAYRAIVEGDGVETVESARSAVLQSYERGVTDEFVKPVRIGDYKGLLLNQRATFGEQSPKWRTYGQEVGLCVNFRPDRMREICAMMLRKNLPADVEPRLVDARGRELIAFEKETLASMTEYDPALDMNVAYPKEVVSESFGEIIAAHGLTQFRCAETEKYAHVTYFFNGGREEAFQGETRKMLPSPRDVPTYDKKPEMAARAVGAAVVEAIQSNQYDFVLVNFANPDMVGHTGDLAAATVAVEAVDRELGLIVEAVLERGGAMFITADHGNCETMRDEKGEPHTAHTTNPVPLIYIRSGMGASLVAGGRLADVAPTMLAILGIEQPAAMTGRSLLVSG